MNSLRYLVSTVSYPLKPPKITTLFSFKIAIEFDVKVSRNGANPGIVTVRQLSLNYAPAFEGDFTLSKIAKT